MISNGSCAVNVESVSSMILSVVTSESSRVPDSCRRPPPTTLTNPVGNSTSVSADGLVKVKESFWQPEKVIGAYRLLEYNNRESLDESYSAQMGFDLDLLRTTDYNNFLELGRTCILPKYRKSPALKLLWKALYNYIVSNNIDVLFGCASFWTINPSEIVNELSYLKKYHLMDEDIMVFPTGRRYKIAPMNSHCNLPENIFRKLPSLIKAYIGVGAKFGDGAVIDYSFKSIDVFTYVDCHSFDERIKKYYGRK